MWSSRRPAVGSSDWLDLLLHSCQKPADLNVTKLIMLVESPKRLNNHRPESKKALNGSITPKMNRHRRSLWQTWRPNHAGAWCAAETMLQELVYLCRWRSNWRLSQELCSDNV